MLNFTVPTRKQLTLFVFIWHLRMGFEHISYLKLKKNTNSFSSKKFNFLCSDINNDILKLDNIGKSYVDMMFSSSLEQHITLPTRIISGNSIKQFDHIQSKSSPIVQSGVFDTGISDHHITFLFVSCCMERKLIHKKFRDHSENCLEALQNFITDNIILSETLKVGWDECSDFDEKFSQFISELYKLYDSCFSIRTKVLSNNRLSKTWLTPDKMILNQRKRNLYKRFI